MKAARVLPKGWNCTIRVFSFVFNSFSEETVYDTPVICRMRKPFLHIGIGKGEPQKKKWIALFLSMVMILSCFSVSAVAEERYLGVMLSTNVMSLDTNLATDGESFEVIADCIDGLTQMDADGAAIPAIAESYDLSKDGKTYTFHLRDAKWSNGTP